MNADYQRGGPCLAECIDHSLQGETLASMELCRSSLDLYHDEEPVIDLQKRINVRWTHRAKAKIAEVFELADVTPVSDDSRSAAHAAVPLRTIRSEGLSLGGFYRRPRQGGFFCSLIACPSRPTPVRRAQERDAARRIAQCLAGRKGLDHEGRPP
ncbi:MAG: hypothetical protein ABSB63_22605 [Spirochaetia bacterium]|jgi:hypothetical protein